MNEAQERKLKDLLALKGVGPDADGNFCEHKRKTAFGAGERTWHCLRPPGHEHGHFFGMEGEAFPKGVRRRK